VHHVKKHPTSQIVCDKSCRDINAHGNPSQAGNVIAIHDDFELFTPCGLVALTRLTTGCCKTSVEAHRYQRHTGADISHRVRGIAHVQHVETRVSRRV
jgi:hypothetical protein